jgi:ataxia telangiectasia mutated family protein
LREYFDQERIVSNLDEEGDGQAWVPIFQALFSAVLKEKETCLRKGLDKATDTAIKKLGTVSDTLRWLTERVYSRLTYKCVKPLIQHCLEITIHHHKLLNPVAFPSLQILRVLLSYPAHRDHIKPEIWLRIVSLSFAILIEDDISTYFTVDEDDEEEVEEIAFDDKMEVDTSIDQAGNDTDASATPSRTRDQSAQARRPKSQKLPRAKPRHVALSREQICAAELIHLLLASPHSNFNHKDLSHLTRAILNKFRRFLEMFPQLTTAHHHIVHGIVLTLCHAEMNCHADVVDFGRKAWGVLSSLWQKKDNVIKESLVMIFTILLPFVTQMNLTHTPLESGEIRKLQDLLVAEAEHSVQSKGLTLDDIRLEIDDSTLRVQPFLMRTFRANNTFSAKQAHYWAVLELHADCLVKVKNIYFPCGLD